MTDEFLLDYAIKAQLTIVTEDSDFDQLALLTRQHHFGIVRVKRMLPLVAAGHIVAALEIHEQELLHGAVVILSQDRTRIRQGRLN